VKNSQTEKLIRRRTKKTKNGKIFLCS